MVTADEMGPENCSAMHGTSIDSVEDMAALGDLHEGAIMYNIKQRYSKDLIYTYIGSIVAALNPYKKIPGIYDDEVRQPLFFVASFPHRACPPTRAV